MGRHRKSPKTRYKNASQKQSNTLNANAFKDRSDSKTFQYCASSLCLPSCTAHTVSRYSRCQSSFHLTTLSTRHKAS